MLHDVSTNRNIEVLRVKNIHIYSAQVSPDGQWILLIVGNGKGRESYKLQRIRIDGQQRETLYTFPPYFYGFREFRPSLNLLDGSRHITLFKSTDLTTYFLNRMTQYGWSDISRDGTMFAMGTFNRDTGSQTLFVSPIHTGKAMVFWDTDAFIVDWTTI